MKRRQFLAGSITAAAAARVIAQNDVEARSRETTTVNVLPPQGRLPASFVIDDSTCLVNMGHFCTPQFAECYPGRTAYQKAWQNWPREIPDDFVREFRDWCGENGVKGKYSIVPYPACVGWLDQELPGWSRQRLQSSLRLVRETMLSNWDIHPEMITHTRVIDLKTGRPMQAIHPGTMENSYPQSDVSVDHLASYLAYALRILKRCGLPCEGITTPGGFGNRVSSKLPFAVDQAVRDVFNIELPHYFKYIHSLEQGTEPIVEAIREAHDDKPLMTVNVPAGTGDWYGGWQGDLESSPDNYLSLDGQTGRLAELIQRRQPVVFLCHWPGMFCNGTKSGFRAFQRNVQTLNEVYGDSILWMKLSEIARYWAAKRVTKIVTKSSVIELDAPLATSNFTLEVTGNLVAPVLQFQNQLIHMRKVGSAIALQRGSWTCDGETMTVCFDLPRGRSQLAFQRT
ncbi:MAG: hypothetical protein AAF664_12335 [Planctomycetota bacterium]